MANDLVKAFNSADQKMMTLFVTGIETSLKTIGMKLDDYQVACAKNSFKKIFDVCKENGIDINVVKDDVSTILERAAMFKLNALAMPAECYIIARDAKKENKVPYLEFGIEGDGNDRLLAEYGTNVKKVYPYWLVRVNDTFKYPSFKGIEVSPPEWTPKDYYGKVVRVVYPIEYNDGRIEYHISERESVKNNLLAHINQNLMGDYFGLSTFGKQGAEYTKVKNQLAEKRKSMIDGIKDKSLEEIIIDASVQVYISPAWKSEHSRESMIVRKMRNNATKPIPKNLKDAYLYDAYKSSSEDEQIIETIDPRINKEDAVDAEVREGAISEPVNFESPQNAPKEAHTETKQNSDANISPETISLPDDNECPY